MSVARYSPSVRRNYKEDYVGVMDEDDNGYYVEYEDYEKLQAELERLKVWKATAIKVLPELGYTLLPGTR